MIDILKDIVKHTHGLGFLDLVKITGDSKETAIDSMAEDRSVILQGSFHKPQAEMSGTFGMPQMGKLDIHLKCPEYKDKAKINHHCLVHPHSFLMIHRTKKIIEISESHKSAGALSSK